MTLTIDQLKKFKLNLGGNSCGACSSRCSYTVSMYDILNSYVALSSFSLFTDSTLSGNGSETNKLKLARQGATTGQILSWNGVS